MKNYVSDELLKRILLNDITPNYEKEEDPKKLKEIIEKLLNININQEDLLLELSKKATIGELIGMIAHQWKQPLNTVSVLVQEIFLILKMKNMVDVLDNELKDDILKQLKYMSHTVDDFRNYFKSNKQKKQINFVKELMKTIHFISPQLHTHHIDIYLYIEKEKYTLENIDKILRNSFCYEQKYNYETLPNELQHVILNIITNSKDQLVLNQIVNPIINLQLTKEKKKFIISISDNANGIKENLENIWIPYYTTKKEGTGLGLFMCKSIVEKNLDGEITASNYKNGLKTTITLKDYL